VQYPRLTASVFTRFKVSMLAMNASILARHFGNGLVLLICQYDHWLSMQNITAAICSITAQILSEAVLRGVFLHFCGRLSLLIFGES